MKISYRQAAADDAVRQFRYYLITLDLPDVAIRFRDALRRTVESLRDHPFVGPRYHSNDSRFNNLRSWPVAGFEAIRIYYFADEETIGVIRILHGKRDVKRILERETVG